MADTPKEDILSSFDVIEDTAVQGYFFLKRIENDSLSYDAVEILDIYRDEITELAIRIKHVTESLAENLNKVQLKKVQLK